MRRVSTRFIPNSRAVRRRWHNLHRYPLPSSALAFASSSASYSLPSVHSNFACHYSTKQRKETNTDISAPKAKIPLQQKVSNFIVNFIKQESKVFAKSLDSSLELYGEPGEEDFRAVLDPRLQTELDSALDYHNKLFIILSHNPISIPPQAYLYFLDRIETPLEGKSRSLLLKRLLYHQQYHTCWKICMDTYTSLTDLEDFLDLASASLTENNCFKFGFTNLLLASQSAVPNQRLHNHILDAMSFKFGIDRARIQAVLEFSLDIETIQTLEDLNSFKKRNEDSILHDVVFEMIYLRKYFLLMENRSSMSVGECYNVLQGREALLTTPGWLTSISPPFWMSSVLIHTSKVSFPTPAIASIMVESINHNLQSIKHIQINESDAVYILRSQGKLKAYNIYSLYSASCKNTNSNKAIINILMKQILCQPHYVQLRSILYRHYQELDEIILITALHKVLEESKTDFVEISRKMFKKKSQTQRLAISKSLIKSVVANQFPIDELSKIILVFHSMDKSGKVLEVLLKSIERHNYSENDFYRFYSHIVESSEIRSTKSLLEVNRSCVLRHGLINANVLGTILERILHMSLRKDVILKRNPPTHKKPPKGFQKLHLLATIKERAAFHNSLRAMGQTFSLLTAEEIALVIDIIRKYVYSSSFNFTKDKWGKEYILRNITSETLRFVDRASKQDSKTTILKLRDILSHVNGDSLEIRGHLFKVIVRDDPIKAIKLIQFYKDRKSGLGGVMKFMISGILTTERLDRNQKLQFLDKFLSELKLLGYRYRIRQSTGHELVSILKQESVSGKALSPQSISWILEFSRNNKALNRVIHVHFRKDKRIDKLVAK
ncbi:uncharacterized protein RJT20DRAFT_131967 [Scheffersomyces xylosifermentans]|uniref:uncharacterized protein n=1 Tax=Scheffersomyces xylosifermentans TaxID=1304137 RepID=UPI00315D9BEA